MKAVLSTIGLSLFYFVSTLGQGGFNTCGDCCSQTICETYQVGIIILEWEYALGKTQGINNNWYAYVEDYGGTWIIDITDRGSYVSVSEAQCMSNSLYRWSASYGVNSSSDLGISIDLGDGSTPSTAWYDWGCCGEEFHWEK